MHNSFYNFNGELERCRKILELKNSNIVGYRIEIVTAVKNFWGTITETIRRDARLGLDKACNGTVPGVILFLIISYFYLLKHVMIYI